MPLPTRRPVPPARLASLLAATACGLTGSALAATPALAAFPGENGRIAFFSDRDGDDPDVWTMEPDGTGIVNLTSDSPAEDVVPNWSPDGRRIAFMSNRVTATNPEGDFELFVMRADGSNVRQLTANKLDDEEPAWSPDGRRLVFARDFKPKQGEVDYDVFTIRADGRSERNLTDSPGVIDVQPDWSPDGKAIAFVSERDGEAEIFTMRRNGSRARQLTFNTKPDESPDWSPDGRRLVFNSERDGKFEIYRMRADGRGQRRLTVTTGDYGNAVPTWSPDGRKIVFCNNSTGAPDVYTMSALDGSGQTNLTNHPEFDYTPDWQAVDGKGGKR